MSICKSYKNILQYIDALVKKLLQITKKIGQAFVNSVFNHVKLMNKHHKWKFLLGCFCCFVERLDFY